MITVIAFRQRMPAPCIKLREIALAKPVSATPPDAIGFDCGHFPFVGDLPNEALLEDRSMGV